MKVCKKNLDRGSSGSATERIGSRRLQSLITGVPFAAR